MDRRKRGGFFYYPPPSVKNRLALTAGDPEGIGKFIIKTALQKLGWKKNFQFVVWTEKKAKTLKVPAFQTLVFKTSKQALESPFNEQNILQIKNPRGPGKQLEEAAKLCLDNSLSALITGPTRKVSLVKTKYKAISQTVLLKKLCRKKDLFMCFRGAFFNTILLTDHIPLKRLSVNKTKLKELLLLALEARQFLKASLQQKPLGVLGLNPHAGEGGLIGEEEKKTLKPLFKSFSPKEVQGPLCPDSAFLKKNWNLYSFFIALYHDQGLIPFKMTHSHKGFVQTLGLPFLRLGVDHGTGRGLRKNEISSESFFQAIKEALRLIKSNK